MTTAPLAEPGRRPRTDATPLRWGTRSTAPALGTPPRGVDYWPQALRLGVELAAGALALGALWAWAHGHSAGVVRGVTAALCVVAAVAGWRAVGWALTVRHRREVVEPLARAVCDLVGRHPLESPRHYLDVPADFAEAGAQPVKLRLPLGFRGIDGQRQMVEAVMGATLGVDDLAFTWSTAGRRPHVAARPKVHPPELVRFGDPAVMAMVEGRPEAAPMIGVAARGELVAVDLDSDAPHVMVNAATGGGKSVLVRALLAQALHHGATATLLDFKRGSHPWATGRRQLDAVDYVRDIGDMHRTLVAIGDEVERRTRLLDAGEDQGDDDDAGELFARHVLVVEEANATMTRLARWWERNRERGDPKHSPAVEAFTDLLYMGRALRMNVILCAQSATVRALGAGPELREQFVCRCLARYTPQAWAMLAGDVDRRPPSSRHKGRVQVVIGGEARATQVVLMSDDEAHVWAASGQRPSPGTLDHLGGQGGTVPGRPALRLVAGDGAELVSLREAIEAGHLGVSLAVARKSRRRDPSFPPPVMRRDLDGADLWTPEALGRWERNRPRGPGRHSGGGLGLGELAERAEL